jgi:hypothetical protein
MISSAARNCQRSAKPDKADAGMSCHADGSIHKSEFSGGDRPAHHFGCITDRKQERSVLA